MSRSSRFLRSRRLFFPSSDFCPTKKEISYCKLIRVRTFLLRPYSRYPGYTAGRFGRVVAQGSLRKAMTPFQKVSGELRVLGHSDQYRLDESRPLKPSPPARWYQTLRYMFLRRTGACGSGERLTAVCRSQQ